ncbi:hypothetical protein AAHA92_09124 [Salvia divinorum]|uniref:Uncharacterized protein n=1 Tax=Salvia divinorum TaxID=28513 RepID=A0ABD1HQF0_SALDI
MCKRRGITGFTSHLHVASSNAIHVPRENRSSGSSLRSPSIAGGTGDRGQWYKNWGLSHDEEGVVFTGRKWCGYISRCHERDLIPLSCRANSRCIWIIS